MRTIWKFPLQLQGRGRQSVTVLMPQGAEIVMVDTQQAQLSLWADVDTTAPREPREFLVVGTGERIPEDATYVGSFDLHNGYYIFHVFETEPL